MSTRFKKGSHIITVIDSGVKSRIKGLGGAVDSIDLVILLTLNGYKAIDY